MEVRATMEVGGLGNRLFLLPEKAPASVSSFSPVEISSACQNCL